MAIVLVNKLRNDFGIAVAGISVAASFGVHVVIWTVMSLVLPKSTNDPGAVIPGAVLVATTLTVLEAVSTLILPDRIARASEVYGAIGASLVALGWLFIVSRAMVLSLAVNAVIHERFGSVSAVRVLAPGAALVGVALGVAAPVLRPRALIRRRPLRQPGPQGGQLGGDGCRRGGARGPPGTRRPGHVEHRQVLTPECGVGAQTARRR